MNLVTMPFVLASITLAGRSFDATGSYDLAFALLPRLGGTGGSAGGTGAAAGTALNHGLGRG